MTEALPLEFPFTLPFGHRDALGQAHRAGVMRRARAVDEITALNDPQAKANPGYALLALLARVVSLDGIGQATPDLIGGLYVADLAYLQSLYLQVNQRPPLLVCCPQCGQGVAIERAAPDKLWRYPIGRLREEIAYIAYHFHWPHDPIAAMEHSERLLWVEEIAKINRRLNERAAGQD